MKSIQLLYRLCVLFFASHFLASAQNYVYTIGDVPFSTQIPIENGFINVNNGEIHIEIPIAQHAQRGSIGLNEKFVYDSRIWRIVDVGGGELEWSPTNVPNSMGGWTFTSGIATGSISQVSAGTSTVYCTDNGRGSTANYYRYQWTDPSGTAHLFSPKWEMDPHICLAEEGAQDEAQSGAAIDGSGFSISLSGSLFSLPSSIIVYDRSGNEVYPLIQDPNGNSMSADSNGNLIDTRGNTPVIATTNGNVTYYDVLDANGVRQRYTVTLTTVSYNTAFNETAVYDQVFGSFQAIQSIALPDGTSYQFGYDSSTVSGHYGELTSVTLPTGGTIQYGYTNFFDSFQNVNRWLSSRTVANAITSFTPSTISTCSSSSGCQEQVKVTDPSGNDTVYTFTLDPSSLTNASSWNTAISLYQGASTSGANPIKSVSTSYTYNTNYLTSGTSQVVGTYHTPATILTKTTLPDIALSSQRLTTYDSSGVNPVSDEIWDFFPSGTGAPSAPTEQTDYSYYSINGGSIPYQTTVLDGSGNILSQVTNSYDQTTPTPTSGLPSHNSVGSSRGNLTSSSQWINTTNSQLLTQMTYDDAGQMLSMTTPNGTTSYSYDSTDTSGNSVKLPTPTSGVVLSTSGTASAYTGQALSALGLNSEPTTYTYDTYGRLSATVKPNQGTTTITYTSPTQLSVASTLGNGTSNDTETFVDGYGRTQRSAVATGNSNSPWYLQDTCYDGNGRVQYQSLPYAGTSLTQASLCSGVSYSYDALGRPVQIQNADGIVQFAYAGRAVKSTDVNGVQKIVQFDALGRETNVCELSTNSTMPGSGSPQACNLDIAGTGFLTTYQYNLANHSVTITQGAQSRVFQTDSLGRTIYLNEPESGVTTYSYVYNNTGLLVTRTKPQANQTNTQNTTETYYQYDSLGRIVSVTYSDGVTPSKYYTYDVAASNWNNFPQSYLKGELAQAYTSTTATAYSYNIAGELTSMVECLPGECGNSVYDKALTFSFDQVGNLTSESDPAMGMISYGRSLAHQLTSLTNQTFDLTGAAGSAQLLSGVQNGPFGATNWQLGNGLNGVRSFDSLGRVSGKWICGSSTQVGCSGGASVYGFSTHWSGKQLTSMCDSVLSQCANLGYDEFGRLVSFNGTSGVPGSYTYSYDRWGNRVAQVVTRGAGPQPSDSVNTSNNQMLSYAYDAAGEVINDGSHTYTYDADGDIIAVDSGNTARYTYDSLGHRVAATTLAQSREYVYDASGQVTSVWVPQSTAVASYIMADGIPVAYRAGSGPTYFVHTDWVGSDRGRTDASGALVATWQSLPYGDNASETDTDPNATYAPGHFGTLDGDTESDTFKSQSRQYAANAARWLTPDPYSGSYDPSNPQSLNRYSYSGNSPSSANDPSGLQHGDQPYQGGDDGALLNDFATLGIAAAIQAIEGIFDTPTFHGSLQARPGQSFQRYSLTPNKGYVPDDPIYAGGTSKYTIYVTAMELGGAASDATLPQQQAPNNMVKTSYPFPANAVSCSTSTGINFMAPPGFNVSNIAANGTINGLIGAKAAVAQFGYYDYQRYVTGAGTFNFYSAYTPVSNISVGAYLSGTGVSPGVGSFISNTYAHLNSSNGATAQQAQFRNLGFDLASGKATYSCQSHP